MVSGMLTSIEPPVLSAVGKSRSSLCPSDKTVASQYTQVALLSTLRHPNIVRYVGTLRENRTLYIFLEFVPGGSIASMLARFGRFDETVIRLYTRQILEGLAYLHESRTVRAPHLLSLLTWFQPLRACRCHRQALREAKVALPPILYSSERSETVVWGPVGSV